MKTLHLLEYLRGRDGETLAVFGTARLVKYLSGKIELVGGSPADRTAPRDLSHLGSGERTSPQAKAHRGPSERARASQWCSLFMHEVAFPSPILAHAGNLYGLHRDEVACILDPFPIVRAARLTTPGLKVSNGLVRP